MPRTSNEICSMAFSTAEMRRRVINIMERVEITSPESVVPVPYTHLTFSPRTLARISMEALGQFPSELKQVPESNRRARAEDIQHLNTGEMLERALREELRLLEELFPEEPALKRKIAQLKWFLAHARLEELQP